MGACRLKLEAHLALLTRWCCRLTSRCAVVSVPREDVLCLADPHGPLLNRGLAFTVFLQRVGVVGV